MCVCVCVCNMFKLLYMNLLQMKINNTAKFTYVVLESDLICSDKLTDQTLFRQTATFGWKVSSVQTLSQALKYMDQSMCVFVTGVYQQIHVCSLTWP